MNDDLKKTQKLRVLYLKKVYELTNGHTNELINGAEVGHQIGLENGDDDLLKGIARYLEGEGLLGVNWVLGGMPASVSLLHTGLKEIEQALSSPNKPTEHFMPINILNVEQMINSTIQQGTIGSTQSININTNSIESVKSFLKELTDSIGQLNLDTELDSELKADISTLKAQISSPKPKPSIVKECLSSVQRILESAAGSAIGQQLATQIPALLVLFS